MASGGYKGASPARETSPEQYPGVWELTEQFQAQADGNWPFQETDCAPKSLRFNGTNSYLTRTPLAEGSKTTWTWSAWVKRCSLGSFQYLFDCGSGSSPEEAPIRFWSDDRLNISAYASNTNIYDLTTTAKFRDTSAWMSIVVSFNSNEAVADDRIKLYINGEQVTAFDARNNPALGTGYYINDNMRHDIGRGGSGNWRYFSGLMSEVTFIDGQALSCEEFGFFDGQGIWQPKRFTGDYSSGPVYSNNASATGGFEGSNPAANGFNGVLTAGNRANGVTVGGTIELTFNPGIPVSTSVGIWSGKSGFKYQINNSGSYTTVTNATEQWHDASFSGTLTNLKIQHSASNEAPGFSGIRTDGTTLLDSSIGRNSFRLDFSDTSSDAALGQDSSGMGNDWTPNNMTAAVAKESDNWSGMTTGSGYNSSTALSGAFDGSDSTRAAAAAGTAFVFTPSTAITGISKVRIKAQRDASQVDEHDFQLNGTNIGQSWSLNSTATIEFTVNNLTSLKWATKSNGQWYSVYKIEIFYDGSYKTLVTNTEGAGAIDSLVDSPVNGNEVSTNAGGERRGNYCSWNPLNVDKPTGASGVSTLSDGNLVTSGSNTDAVGTIGVSSGKWYFEVTRSSGGSNDTNGVGFVLANTSIEAIYRDGGLFQYNASSSSYGATWSTDGVVIGVALDLDNSSITFYKNGASQGVAKSDLPAGTWIPLLLNRSTSTFVANFGQKSFSQTPPAGFSPIATSFLPETTIKRGDEAATVALYTGNEGGQTVQNLRLSPDLVWIKNRSTNPSSGHYWHIHDTVRGKTGSFYNALYTNGSESENTYAGSSYGGLSDITDDGFTLSPAAGYSPAHLNTNGTTYAAFCWDAGETTTTISAGGLTSSAYNQSQTWSNGTQSNADTNRPLTNLFDNSTSTLIAAPSGSNSSNKITLPVSITAQTSVRYYSMGGGYNNGPTTLSNSGTTVSTIAAESNQPTGWKSFTGSFPMTFNEFTVQRSADSGGTGSGAALLEVDGKILVDNGVSVANVPSIATTVRARPETGFSIATYTGNSTGGATVAHGLNKKPDFFMIGCRNVTNGNYWDLWHSVWYEEGVKNYMRMASGSTNGAKYAADMFQTPTALVNTLGSSSSQNGTNNYVMYSWTSVEGYSSFGEFTGVGSESTGEGPFVYCGFKPAVILWKSHSVDGSNWFIVDTFRHPDNVNDAVLRPNTNGEETDNDYIDVLSNGFKVRATPSFGGAGNGYKFLYAAWAENPFGSQTRAN